MGSRRKVGGSAWVCMLPVLLLSSQTQSAAQPTSKAVNPAAQILWFFGSPEAVSHIGQGETVQWQWWDNLAHSVEGVGAAEGMFTGIGGGNVTVAGKGFLYNYTFNVPGTFKYRCANHTTAMIGTVMVKPKFNFGGVLLPWYDGVSIGGASAIVRQGDTVQWQWLDFLGHSLLTSGGAPEEFTGPGANGSIITQYGFVYNRTFTKTGSYPYVCSVHGASMKGIIRVLPSTATVPPSPPLPGPPGPDPNAPATVIQWFFGTPSTVSHIGQGETVQWLWTDELAHSVEGVGAAEGLFKGKGAGANVVADQGFAYNYTFKTPGEYLYQCHEHPNVMFGSVIVKPKENPGGVTIPWYNGVSYGGASAVVEQGDTVKWQWADDFPHSLKAAIAKQVTFTGKGGDDEIVTQSGFEYAKKFTKVGTFEYVCPLHANTMRGEITVVKKGSLSPKRPTRAPPGGSAEEPAVSPSGPPGILLTPGSPSRPPRRPPPESTSPPRPDLLLPPSMGGALAPGSQAQNSGSSGGASPSSKGSSARQWARLPLPVLLALHVGWMLLS